MTQKNTLNVQFTPFQFLASIGGIVATLLGATWLLSAQLSQTATKTDLMILATKADLNHEVSRLDHRLELVESRLQDVSNRVAKTEVQP